MIRLLFGLAAVVGSLHRARSRRRRRCVPSQVEWSSAATLKIPRSIFETPRSELAALLKLSADLSETQKKLIAELEQKFTLNQQQVRAALAILGEADIPPEQLGAKLVEVAERFKDLRATASPQTGDDPKIAALKIDARKAIDAGKLAEADDLLALIEAEARRSLDRLAVNAAATLAQRGEIALTRLRYADAAKHFADAAAVFPPGSSHETERMRYLDREAQAAHYQQGDEFGDNDALQTAIARNKRLIELRPRARMPLEWARTQMNLGVALQTLGARESGTARLEEAVAAFRAALEERTRARMPLQWAMTQQYLGNALWALGTRERNDTAGGGGRGLPGGAGRTNSRAHAAPVG